MEASNNIPNIIYFTSEDENAIIPFKAHNTDVGYDIFSNEDIDIPPNGNKLVKTGIKLIINNNIWIRIENRSSMAKKGIFVVNGIIDPTYTGEIIINIINSTSLIYSIKKKDKIAQLVEYNLINSKPKIITYDEFKMMTEDFDRKDNGFGSTNNLETKTFKEYFDNFKTPKNTKIENKDDIHVVKKKIIKSKDDSIFVKPKPKCCRQLEF